MDGGTGRVEEEKRSGRKRRRTREGEREVLRRRACRETIKEVHVYRDENERDTKKERQTD